MSKSRDISNSATRSLSLVGTPPETTPTPSDEDNRSDSMEGARGTYSTLGSTCAIEDELDRIATNDGEEKLDCDFAFIMNAHDEHPIAIHCTVHNWTGEII